MTSYNKNIVNYARKWGGGVLTEQDLKRAQSTYNPSRNIVSRATEFFRKAKNSTQTRPGGSFRFKI